MIIVEQTRNDFENDIGPLVRSFYPGVTVCMKENPPKEPVEYRLRAEVGKHSMRLLFFDAEGGLIFDVSDTAELSDKKEYRNIIKRLLYRALSSYTKKTLPWGAQTGVRPAKIALDRLKEGWTQEAIRDFMKVHYLCSEEKTELALTIAQKEYSLLSGLEENGYSIYIGIAFCPSKCLYCSFPSYSVEKFGGMMDDYLLALFQEIDYAKDCMGKKQLQTVYVGGGTPTALDEVRLERLLEKITNTLDFTFVQEFTVEAGRPDSITREKLVLLKRYGVTRISVNPQTMNQRTLDIIGRRHTVEDVKRAFFLAREEGHDNINMDLIMGLPGEDLGEVRHTLKEIEALSPDSLTVHTLAIKRAADLNIYRERYQAMVPLNTSEMLALAEKFTAENGYFPYYLYRQKNMTGNLENVGYAKERKEGLYNILIMEEQQTILALGAGATSKYVFPTGGRIERTDNCKSITDYIYRIDEMIDRKRKFLEKEGNSLGI
jgi:oxygen-independent coproporphyrinogen-3 oxidase